jgi:hypothetical protein
MAKRRHAIYKIFVDFEIFVRNLAQKLLFFAGM